MKVLFAASECAPIVKVGGLADVVGSLPKALADLGIEVAIALPNYVFLGENPPKFLANSQIPVFYLGSQKDYQGEVYPGGYNEYKRFTNFSREVVNFLSTRTFEPQIIHCHDYHTALIPDILRERKENVATVLTLHDAGNEPKTEPSLIEEAELSTKFLRVLDYDLKDRQLDPLMQGILSADVINTVSPTYAKEILRREISGDLSDVFKAREARVFGILNGIDTQFYDSRQDKFINQNYGAANSFLAKKQNKSALQKSLRLKNDVSLPLYGMVTRLVERKGIDLVIKNIESIINSGVQLVILGKGEAGYEKKLMGLAKVNKDKIVFINKFDEALSHKIYAASDFFLVPSRTEPCGLTQMIAQRYGSLPLVHKTGGLADTIVDGVTGFVFSDYSPESFLMSFKESVETYFRYNQLYQQMQSRAMAVDFSWKKSALEYVKLYEKALQYNFGLARTTAFFGGEIRERPLGGWTILSEGRALRPSEKIQNDSGAAQNDVILASGARPESNTDEVLRCPFESGHEYMSTGEVFRIGPGEPDNPGWEVRVIPNKFPLVPAHEVIIHSPNHDKDLDDLPLLWVEKIVWVYLSRYRHYEEKGYIHIFCNHGKAAAASLTHPHSQIVVLDKLPQDTLNTLEAGSSYFESHHRCPYCQTIDREKSLKTHLVFENNEFVVVTPYASEWPFELSIIPKTHRQSFGNIKDEEIKALAQTLQTSIKLLKTQFKDLSYNFWIHSLPELLGYAKTSLYYHWHLDIIPRVKVLGGLELGVGVMVDDLISPEKATEVLRNQLEKINL